MYTEIINILNPWAIELGLFTIFNILRVLNKIEKISTHKC